ncbi:hypothetical protein KC19_N042800 [Ceratodon purpureus]|nr:hypothetical protein KC19_N042800 [Ceratodon purpureus]
MVLIELAEDDAPEYEQRKPKKNLKSASPITQEAASIRTDSTPAEGKDPTVQPTSGGAQPQSNESLTETPAQAAQLTGHPDDTLKKLRTEGAGQAKSKKKGDSHADGEGDGWETASEGSEEADDVSHSGDPASSDEKAATTSENNEDHFEDALTEEELRAKALSLANEAKSQGNSLYVAGKYSEALECYASALEGVANDPSANELRAQCYSNRAICEINLKNYKDAVTESTKALELDPNYVKALMRRAQANESLENGSVTDLKKALELDPSNKVARVSIIRLEPIVEKKREELKEEMIGKLKELGNNVLGKFGMSVDDFKAVKDPNTGSYSISFGKS